MSAIFLLLLLAWSSSVISYSPLLELCGMKFYEVTTAKGETLIVIDSTGGLTLGAPLDLVRISDECYIRK